MAEIDVPGVKEKKDKANWGKADDYRQLALVKAFVPREQMIRQRFGNNHTNADRSAVLLWKVVE